MFQKCNKCWEMWTVAVMSPKNKTFEPLEKDSQDKMQVDVTDLSAPLACMNGQRVSSLVKFHLELRIYMTFSFATILSRVFYLSLYSAFVCGAPCSELLSVCFISMQVLLSTHNIYSRGPFFKRFLLHIDLCAFSADAVICWYSTTNAYGFVFFSCTPLLSVLLTWKVINGLNQTNKGTMTHSVGDTTNHMEIL